MSEDIHSDTWYVEHDEPEGRVLHIRVEAFGEAAEEIQKAVDNLASMREQLPPPDDDDSE